MFMRYKYYLRLQEERQTKSYTDSVKLKEAINSLEYELSNLKKKNDEITEKYAAEKQNSE